MTPSRLKARLWPFCRLAGRGAYRLDRRGNGSAQDQGGAARTSTSAGNIVKRWIWSVFDQEL